MQNWDVTLKGHFDVPIADDNIGEIIINFQCVIETDTPWSAMSKASDHLNNSFNKGVGYISPTIDTIKVEPHYE